MPSPDPVAASALAGLRHRGVAHADRDLGLAVAEPDCHLGTGRVLADVGQRLAHHPVGGAADHRGGQRRVAFLGQLGRDADRVRLGDQRGDPGQGDVLAIFGHGPQDADQVSQLVQRLAAGRAQFLGGAPGRIVAGGDAEGARLQDHQAEPVRDDVVHLARQPGALLRPGLLGQQGALPLGPLGAVAQRLDHAVPGREVQRRAAARPRS